MNIKTLEEKIADKANAEVQEAVRTLCRNVAGAVNSFIGEANVAHAGSTYGRFTADKTARLVVENLLAAENVQISGWPRAAWWNREQAIRNEIMEKMDIVQRTLVSPPRAEGDASPAGESHE